MTEPDRRTMNGARATCTESLQPGISTESLSDYRRGFPKISSYKEPYRLSVPFSWAFLSVASRPFLLMVRITEVATLSVIHSPVEGTKKRFFRRLGLNLRLVLLLACDTLLPTRVLFPENLTNSGHDLSVLQMRGQK